MYSTLSRICGKSRASNPDLQKYRVFKSEFCEKSSVRNLKLNQPRFPRLGSKTPRKGLEHEADLAPPALPAHTRSPRRSSSEYTTFSSRCPRSPPRSPSAWLRKLVDNGAVKVLVGMRWSGKSTSLELLARGLEASGVEPERIVRANFESAAFFDIADYRELPAWAHDQADGKGRCHLLFDEVQLVSGWERTAGRSRGERAGLDALAGLAVT